MQLLTFLSICLTLGTNAIAKPAAPPPSPKPTNTANSSYSYLLQTHVIHGGPKEFDGLYVQSYHTGAGTNDVVLGKSQNAARRGQLYKGVQYFEGSGFPETFFLFEGTTYDAWYPVELNAGVFTSGLFFNSTGLQWAADHSFGGWLACQWSHGIPQLFWKVNYYTYSTPLCAQVELRPVEKGKLFKIQTL